jgi:uncharacterized protein YbjQ (UPF0145 family)
VHRLSRFAHRNPIGIEIIQPRVGRLGELPLDAESNRTATLTGLQRIHARQHGADAIIAMRYDATEFAPGVTEVLAYGTAVKLAPDDRLG